MEKDIYNTIAEASSEVLYKQKGSKFYGYAFPVQKSEQIKTHLDTLKKKHHSARHWCYAWQLGKGQNIQYRANDDGEPNNSAGKPIYGQIQAFELTDILIVVVRYFGGTKLGVGGLISAYREAAKMALEASAIEQRLIKQLYLLQFEYRDMSKVMRLIKELKVTCEHQELDLDCKMTIAVRKNDVKKVKKAFLSLYEVRMSPL